MKVFSHPNIPAYTGFVYIWMNTEENKFYIGSHQGHIDDGYVGSGAGFKPAYKNNPKAFKRRILEYICGNYIDLIHAEEKWLSMIKIEEMYGRKYYNNTKLVTNTNPGRELILITNGVNELHIEKSSHIPDGWRRGRSDRAIALLKARVVTEETKNAIRQSLLDVPHTRDRVEQSRSSKLDKKYRWYTDGVEEIILSKDETPPIGWTHGRINGFANNRHDNNTGLIKLTNGINEMFVHPDEPIPDGWRQGRADHVVEILKNNKALLGRVVINNGVNERFIDREQPLPDGWVVGRVSSSVRGKIMIHNGVENTYIISKF